MSPIISRHETDIRSFYILYPAPIEYQDETFDEYPVSGLAPGQYIHHTWWPVDPFFLVTKMFLTVPNKHLKVQVTIMIGHGQIT